MESEKTNLITYFILMNNNLLSKTMRNAISYVIDYDYIIYEIMGGTAERLKSAIPNGIIYANDTFNYPVYNITKARQFLVDGGIVPAYYNDGVNDYHDFQQHINGTMPPIAEYTYIYNADNLLRGKIGILLKDNLENLGIKLTLNGMSFSKYISYLIGFPPYSRDDFHLAMAGWVEDYNDPINYINTLLNPSQIYDYAQVDDLYLNTAMEEALKITDPKAREAKYDEMQQYIIEDLMPLAYLYVQNLSCAHHRDLTGFQQNAFNNLNFHICQWNRTQYSMEITRPNDLTFFEGTIGNSITWNITAMNVSTPIYYVYKGMDLVQSDVWDSGVPVNINIDELSTGTYQYRIEVHNSDKIVEDIVDVKVVDIESNIPFIYGLSSRVRDLDPVDAWDIASINVLDQVAEGLFTYNYSDPSNAIIPNLAADMGTWSADYKNYTVTLKPNITFHDGTPFNATAVKFSVDRYQYFMNATGELTDWYYPTTAQLYVWPNQTLIINRTEVIDDYTVRFVLNHYYAPFEALLCFPSMYILSPTAHAAHATTRIPTDETGDIVGTGPFVFDGYNPLVNVTFHAFEDYRKGPAQIKSLVFSIIIDPFDRFLALLNGDIGMVDRIESLYVNTIDPDMISILKNDPGITVLESEKTSTDINLISMNNNFLDNITRKAIAYAIDYDFIIDEIMEGTAERLKSAIPNGIIYANDTFDYPTFNITFARTIMQWMGYGVGWNISYNPDNPYANPDHYNWINANFMQLKYIYNTDNLLRAKFGILLMENLMLIGINVTLTGMSFYEFLYRLYRIPGYTTYEFHLANMGWWPDYNDPSDFINPLFTPGAASNYGEVDEPLYNQWMDEALKITDPKAREAKYDDIQQIIIEDLVNYAYTHVQKLVCAHHSDLTGFQQNAFNKLNFHTCLWKPIPPGNFNLTTGAGTPDTDGNFNLNWTISANAQNYSVYQYSQFITKINGSLTPLILETVALSLPLSGYSDGTYYFIVVAHNEFGNTLSDCIDVVVQIPQPPGPFTLYSDAGTPDTDGNFNLNWTISVNAQNYSVYQYSQFITKINGSLTPLLLETENLTFPISGLTSGDYYFIVVAHNEYGNTLSNCLKVSIQIPPGPFTLYSDTGTSDDDGNFNLNWTISVNGQNYSVYQYSQFITKINGSLTPLILETEDLTFPISGLTSGDY
ncbi:MAG: ABC transporter substrate-binding protein, partial [Promethearchaeota archaeon]